VRGEIRELTTLIYEAREEALAHIAEDARRCNADRVVGIKTYVYNLGGGIIEFLAIGTAVRRMPGLETRSEQLIPQAIIRDQDTFINTAETSSVTSLNQPTNINSSLAGFIGLGVVAFYMLILFTRFFVR
jgi:hypothetical protein